MRIFMRALMKRLFFLLLVGCTHLLLVQPVYAQGQGSIPIPAQYWSFESPLGKFDRSALQRGLQIYIEICASCHSLRHLRYQDLEFLGYSKEDVKRIAQDYQVQDGPDDEGQMYQRPAMPQDFFVEPFANEQAARAANGGAYPPDLSLIALSRRNALNYLAAMLQGYREPPPGLRLHEGKYYNIHFPGKQIGMPPPLLDDIIEYEDGTLASVEQMALDITTFLAWTAEPKAEKRKSIGLQVIIFLLFLMLLMMASKKRIWKKI